MSVRFTGKTAAVIAKQVMFPGYWEYFVGKAPSDELLDFMKEVAEEIRDDIRAEMKSDGESGEFFAENLQVFAPRTGFVKKPFVAIISHGNNSDEYEKKHRNLVRGIARSRTL